ncbi:myo-inositol catabolism protein iolE [Legionella birminghamensis]|uniref:Myo-inositol catabolism protein iolE n=1 Tax=Legionella birminghamensis TaxID=28083 RepID=A0A378IA27_9GAMM|nr:myo-inosose-2 dehydratase [Legionella birminghamensis]KTC68915.1 myo-inositol catabolism protein iolE [Legionella birminghamensis]STX31431.1 myo-inositol catabolism protein iolE [Legionella birminghamensis]
MKLGIAPINWCNDDDPHLGGDISFEQCISEMVQAGYQGTELGNKFPRDPSFLKATLDETGLKLSSAWFSTHFTEKENYQRTLSRFLDHMSFMRAMDSKFINVCECGHAIQGTTQPVLGQTKPVFNEEQWNNLIQGLHAIGRIAHDHDMQLVYHYHAGTGVFNAEEIDFLMQNTSPDLLSLLLDTGHAALAGIHPMTLLRTYRDRIKYVHLKDIRKAVYDKLVQEKLCFMDAVREGVFTVPGDGMIDFAPIISELKQMGYQGWLLVEAEQDPEKAPPLEYAKKAYDYLQKLCQ